MMRVLLICILIVFYTSCTSTARYNSIKRTRYKNTEKKKDNQYKSSKSIEEFIQNWKGTPYLYGGMSKNGIDCSGLSLTLYRDIYNKKIPRTSRDQYLKGYKIGISKVVEGDLVFFRGVVRRSGIDHVGIYLGNMRFLHASVSSGVMISSLQEDYYKKRFVGFCRF